jgi:hypothetical protein
MGDPSADMTASDVKFSDGIRLIDSLCRRFSFSTRSNISGSTVSSGDVSRDEVDWVVKDARKFVGRNGLLEEESRLDLDLTSTHRIMFLTVFLNVLYR